MIRTGRKEEALGRVSCHLAIACPLGGESRRLGPKASEELGYLAAIAAANRDRSAYGLESKGQMLRLPSSLYNRLPRDTWIVTGKETVD